MKIKISTLMMAMLFVHMAFSQNDQGVMTREAPVEISAAFWDFETGFTDLLEGIETTGGDDFVIFNDPERGNVLEMPGGQSAESSLVYGDAGGITGNTPRLLKFWVKTGKLDGEGDPVEPDNVNDVNNGVITNWGVNTNGERFTVRISNGNQMRVEVQGGFAQTIDDVIFPHQWHHVVIHLADVENASTTDISIWVDGIFRPVSTGARVINTQPGEFAFGWNSIIGRTLFGYIDDFFVMNQSPVYAGDGDHVITLYSGSGDATDISGSGFYDEGEVVSLQATAPAGYTFTSWTYPDGTVASTNASFDFTMPDDNVILVANFDVPLYDLTLEVDPEDAGTLSGGGSYPPFTEVTISATPKLGYAFVNWTDEQDEEVSDQATFVYTMPENEVTLTANFVEIPVYTLNLEVNPENAGTASGGGQYPQGEVVTVSVDPDVFESFAFENWTLNGNEESTEISFSFTMPGEDVTLVANFEAVVPQEFEFFVSDQWETEDGHFETIHAAVNHVKANDDIVARSVVTIHVAEGVFEESANPVFNNISKPITLIIQGAGVNGAGQLATVVKSDLTERPPKGVGFGRRFAQLNNANNEGLELILKDLKFLYWGFGNTNGGGVVNAIANTEMKISIVNCEFDEVAARAGAIIQSLPGNKHEVLIDNILVQNSLAFDRAEKQGLLHFSGTSNLVIKNSTFMSNENDPLNFNNSEIDEGRKRGVAITLRNASDDPMQVLLENNVFVDNKVVDDPNVDDDNVQPVISVEFDGGIGQTHLTMMGNAMIGNIREETQKGINNDADLIFSEDPRLVWVGNESNLLTKAAAHDGVTTEFVSELPGFIINHEFVYDHPAIAFEMDGDLPEVFYDAFGVGFLQYSGTGVLILELPEASDIVYGQPLSESDITGGETATEGTFTFDEPGFVPEAAGSFLVDITFTTADELYSESATLSINVVKKELTVINAVAEDKVYDGNDQAVISGAELDGVLEGDDVVLENQGEGVFDQVTVGADIPVSTAMTISGADAENYSLLQPVGLQADISARELTIVGSFTVQDKIADGTTDAELDENNLELSNVVANDDVELTDVVIAFAQSEPGSDIAVEIVNAVLTGEDAANYTLSLDGAPQATGNILEILAYTFDVEVNPDYVGEVSVSPEQDTYEAGDVITLVATEITGQGAAFVNWTDDQDNEVGTTATLEYVMPSENVSLTANFEKVAEIIAFDLGTAMATDPVIDSKNATVWQLVVFETDLTALEPAITLSDNASYTPEGEVDFSEGPVVFTVTPGDENVSAKEWAVNVELASPTATRIRTFDFLTEVDGDLVSAGVVDSFTTDDEEGEMDVWVKFGTDIAELAPHMTLSFGATIDPVPQQGDFTEFGVGKDYLVTAADEETTQEWTVTVYESPNTEAMIHAFFIEEQTGEAVIDQEAATIHIEVEFGTDVSGLTPTLTISENATVNPESGEEVDFTQPEVYTVTAQDGVTTREYMVTVSVAENNEAEILAFSLPELTGLAMINSQEASVWAEVVFGTDVTSLSPSISVSQGATINPESGEEVDFTDPVAYIVTAEDGTIKTWSVSVTVAANTAADILMFELDEQTGPAEIDMDEQEIHIEVEFGTDVTVLTPSITISANAAIDPMSGVPQDFTEPVVYTVTAEDMVTMKEWTVFVTVADDPVAPYPIPFAEDFTGVEVGTIPVDWARTHTNWGVSASNNAGGEAPEMRLNWSPSTTDQVRLHTPLLDATEVDFDLSLAFKHMIDWYSESFDLMVQITTDGEEWTDLWSITVTGDVAATTEVVDLNDYTGQQFVLAFVFDGETTFDINQWYIDDVFVGEYFAPETFTLSLVPDPAEGGTVSGAGEYEAGTAVALEAVSNEGFAFVNWTLGGDEVSADGAFTYTMPAEDVTLMANFEAVAPETYTLTLEADPAEGGTVAGGGEYEAGTVVALTATPADNYVFLRWTDANDVEISTEASFDFTMPAEDVTLIAEFDIEDFVEELDGSMINLFPNPASEVFTITASSNINAVVITDITGKVVFNDLVNNTEMVIRNQFETGVYIVRIYTEEGVSVRKLQINR